MTERKRETVYQEVTDRIIADLEQGRVSRVQPWGTPGAKASPEHPHGQHLFRDQHPDPLGRGHCRA